MSNTDDFNLRNFQTNVLRELANLPNLDNIPDSTQLESMNQMRDEQRELEKLYRQLRALKERYFELREQLRQLEHEIDNIESRISEIEARLTERYGDIGHQPSQIPRLESLARFRDEAENVVERQDIRKIICPALKSVSDDAVSISNAITPVLVGAVMAGTIAIPLNPILFAMLALIITKMSIAALCHSYS